MFQNQNKYIRSAKKTKDKQLMTSKTNDPETIKNNKEIQIQNQAITPYVQNSMLKFVVASITPFLHKKS